MRLNRSLKTVLVTAAVAAGALLGASPAYADDPVAANDQGMTRADEAFTTNVLTNDGPGLTVTTTKTNEQLDHGKVTLTAAGDLTYQAGSATGTDTFEYTVADATGKTASATVTVTVIKLAAAPDTYTTSKGRAADLSDVFVNDTIGGLETYYYNFQTESTKGGTVTVDDEDDSISYQPAADFVGVDIVEYCIAANAKGDFASCAMVTITVTDAAPGGNPQNPANKPAPGGAATGGNLPVTGAPARTVAGFGTALLLLGIACYVLSRRRRPHVTAA